MKKLMLFILAGMLAFSACKKDPITVDPPTPPVNNRNFTEITTSVAGLVMDENNQAVSGAIVSFGQKTTTTDDNGVFKIDNATVLENRAFVKVSKDGYFAGSRTFFAYANQRSQVRIHLLEKTIQGTITSSGGIVTLPEGVKLDFPANAVMDADNNPYTGTVQVAAKYLSPTADDILQIMPGDLRGITTENVEEGLTTYGMVAVELLGSAGEVLNVADGKTVQISMPVAAAQMSDAPSEIPLWYFDEATGVWKEDGVATLQGNEYVGNVSHFTFWNWDVNWGLIYLDGSILLEGSALEGTLVCLEFNGAVACDYTNEMGIFSGQVPTNTTFTLTVSPSGLNCSTPIYTQEIGPFTADATIDPIETATSTSTLTVTGTITDCDNNAITDGYVKITLNGVDFYAYTSDGTIDYELIHCSTSGDISIIAIDLNAVKQSDVVSFVFTNSIDLGNIQACEQLDEFIIYEIDGSTYTLTEGISINDSLGMGDQFLIGYGANQTYFSMSTPGNEIGTFNANFWISGVGGNTTGNTITFTQYSSTVGETCTGTFEGTVDTQSGTLPITGSFKAIREF